jgi:hypothetical protein
VPFVASRRLEDMVDPKAVTVAGRAMTEKGGQRLMEATKARTPIDTSARGGLPSDRPRGTARESVIRTAVKQHVSTLGRGWQVRVYTEDPVFPYIEWNTRPHLIEPTPEHKARAEAEGRQAMLRYYQGGRVRMSARVMHPGTTGQHPFARAAAFIEAEVPHMFREELARFARDLVPSRTGRIIDHTGRQPVGQILNASVASWIRKHSVGIAGSGRRAVNDMLGGGQGA